ncbi:hypothetical protein PQX77_006611 [Marasmius sp. AFHP31]|nr:hypothetical protein PQX77_006611 [Marasmius sp. AFHP31]
MSLRRPAAPTQSDNYKTPGGTPGRIHGGAYTNSNTNPFANTLNGDTSSFSPSIHIQDNQCQDVQNHYAGCHFYNGIPRTAGEAARAADHITANQAQSENAPYLLESRSLLMSFYWPWTLLNSFIRVVLRAAAIPSLEHHARDTLPRHARDLEDNLNTNDRSPPSFTPSLTPRGQADEAV